MKRPTLACLGLLFLLVPLTAAAESSRFSLQYTPPARPADVLTLVGKQRFNRGQLLNIAFYIGDTPTSAQVVSTDEVRLVVPDLAAARMQCGS